MCIRKRTGYCIRRTNKEMVCSILVHDESYATGGDSMNKWLKISLYFLGGIVLLAGAGKVNMSEMSELYVHEDAWL